MKDVQTKSEVEEFASSMEGLVAMKDVQTKSEAEEFASSMEQHRELGRLAVMKDAPT